MRARRFCFLLALPLLLTALAGAQGLETRRPTPLYDAPSTKARALFILSGGYPAREIARVAGWRKAQTADGDEGWLAAADVREAKRVVVYAARATVRAAANAAAPPVFFVKRGVALEALPAAKAGADWTHVLHPDGESGYVESGRVWRNH